MRFNHRYPHLALVAAFCYCACDEDLADRYIDPQPVNAQMAAQIWQTYLPEADFTDVVETVPTSETDTYFEEYFENTTMATEATRDVVITYTDTDATIQFEDDEKGKNEGALQISKSGAHVTIHNISGEGRARMNYILRGKSSNGSLRIYSLKKFCVTLDGIELTNAEGAAINVQKATEKKRMFVRLVDGTTNHLADATQYSNTIEGEDEKGALFSEGKIIFFGKGTLSIEGNKSHALAADDDIYIHSGVKLTLTAAKDGIHTNHSYIQMGGQVQIVAQSEAIQTDTISHALMLNGGRLLTFSKRMAQTYNFCFFNPAQFCGIELKEGAVPNYGNINFAIKDELGYRVLYSE